MADGPRKGGFHLSTQLSGQLSNEFSLPADSNNCLQGVVCLTARRGHGDSIMDRKFPETELRVVGMLCAFIAKRAGTEIFSNLRPRLRSKVWCELHFAADSDASGEYIMRFSKHDAPVVPEKTFRGKSEE